MQTDRYTRVMLTIIALGVVWLCLRDTAPPALAQSAPVDVIIRGVGGGVQALPLGVLPVRVQGTVNVR